MTKLPDEDYVEIGVRNDPDEPEQLSSHSSNDDRLDAFYEKCVEQGRLFLAFIAGCRLRIFFPASGKHVLPDLTMCVHIFVDFKPYSFHALVRMRCVNYTQDTL